MLRAATIQVTARLGLHIAKHPSLIHFTNTGPGDQVCFPADTLVATETGLRRISKIEVGERVWSYDFPGATWRLSEVQCRHDSIYDGTMVTISVGDDDVTATAYHPFWVVEGKGLASRPRLRHVNVDDDRGESLPGRWVNSHDLQVGDVVFLRQGGPVVVCRIIKSYTPTAVCNLTVKGLHTFAVGKMQTLVHNVSGTGNAPKNGDNAAQGQHGLPVVPPDEASAVQVALQQNPQNMGLVVYNPTTGEIHVGPFDRFGGHDALLDSIGQLDNSSQWLGAVVQSDGEVLNISALNAGSGGQGMGMPDAVLQTVTSALKAAGLAN